MSFTGCISISSGKSIPMGMTYIAVAVLYLAVNMSLSRVARHLEVRQRRRYRAGGISIAGAEDLVAVAVAADAKMKG